MTEAKTALKARLEAELSAAGSEDELSALRAKFLEQEREMEHTIDHTVHNFSAVVDVEYNFLCAPAVSNSCVCLFVCLCVCACVCVCGLLSTQRYVRARSSGKESK